MKRLLLTLLLALPMAISAQETTEEAPVQTPAPALQFGYLSYRAILQQMPEYATAQTEFAALKAKYDAEATRSEEEFQRKFAEFIKGQKDFPASIMQKRQAELQELMEKSVSFREQSRSLLRQAERELQSTARQRLEQAIAAVATEQGLAFVANTDGNSLPFVNPEQGRDISELVLIHLGIVNKVEAAATD